jgi:hypothetical protein
VFANNLQYETAPLSENTRMEAHHDYIDVQIVLEGEERMYVPATEELTQTKAYDKENDYELAAMPQKDRVVAISDRAFAENASIGSVVLPEGLKTIGEGAFYNCTELYLVEFPSTLKVIENNAFAFCGKLIGAELPKGLETIGNQAFANCLVFGLGVVTIPDTVTNVGASAFAQTLYETMNDSEFVIVGDGVLIDYNGDAAKVTVPDGVKVVSSAFRGNTTVTEVVLPDSVTVVNDRAFSSCEALEKVTLGKGVTALGEAAFLGCAKLQELVLPAGVKSVGASAFYKCTALKTVTLPASLETVGSSAFSGCTALDVVTYGADAAAWGKVSVAAGNEMLLGATFNFAS